jgi:RHS repeat-associated protein
MLIAKHFDPVLGIDIHILVIPPAGPIPIPHPHIALVIDPIDYVPILGATVLVGGIPRASAGTAGIPVPHIPLGGPFAKPPMNENEIFMGSATVLAEDTPLSFTALPVLSCHDIGMIAPIRAKKPKKSYGMVLPTSIVMPIPVGMPVMVGGPPTIDMMGMAIRGGMAALGGAFRKLRQLQRNSDRMRSISNAIHSRARRIMDSLGVPANARNRIHRNICAVTGHPVDVANGKMFTDHIDFELPGPLPLVWERVWYSTSVYDGPLGHGWHHSYDLRLSESNNAVAVRLADGRAVAFPVLKINDISFDRAERLTLRRDTEGYALDTHDGLRYRFTPFNEQSDNQLLTSLTQKSSGARIQFQYNPHAQLYQIVDSANRIIRITYTDEGRIHQIYLPDPQPNITRSFTEETWCCTVTHHYRDGLLIAVTDAMEQPLQYRYAHGLLVKETYRNGLSFYFEYDGVDHHARCIKTWGDGDIYFRHIHYDDANQITYVKDSLGNVITYHHNGVIPHKIIDPLQHTSLIEYNEYSQIISETNELGHKTCYAFDEFGNQTTITRPDGSKVQRVFDQYQNLTEIIDPVGGSWRYEYDQQHRPITKKDPLGQKTRYTYEDILLVSITDAGGNSYYFHYDQNLNIRRISEADGTEAQWEYDALGNVLVSQDSRGNRRIFQRDKLGRIIRVDEPDGNIRRLAYDTADNVVRAKDQQYDVFFAYQGMGRLASRSQNGTTVKFEYDREEQLTAIANEHGRVYQFELDANGEVSSESGFDGLIRQYERDPCQRVVRINRPDNRHSILTYDPMSRPIQILHSDGTRENYTYRADGELLKAANNFVTTQFERDPLGRVTKEIQGDYWVASQFDAMGLRTHVQSSFGLNQTIERDQRGDVTKVSTGPDHFEALFQRDAQGLEIQRTLPGGIQSRWGRDKLGRPIRHEIYQGQQQRSGKTYVWGVNDRLLKIINSLQQETLFNHDPLGNLVSARYSDNHFEMRMPDAVGNLFKSLPQKDREYGPAGQLVAVHTPKGTVRYEYDPEGNLCRKLEPNNRTWRYEWSGAGTLQKVIRPDGKSVCFTYDALGRRISKTFNQKITRWVWDGNNPLHEWCEKTKPNLIEQALAQRQTKADEIAADQRDIILQPLEAQGPPDGLHKGNKETPVTWLFEPESFTPMAKLIGDEYYSIVTDYLGTPTRMFDKNGEQVWSAEISIWGELRELKGAKDICPFRWPGQYEDSETGLYYNRFRYYDPAAGQYVSQDPIRLGAGKLSLYTYVNDTNKFVDVLGLKACFDNADAERYAEDIIRRHGGTKLKDGHYRMPNRRAARQAASEIAGDLGSEASTVRKRDYRGGPRTWGDSDGRIGAQSRDKSSGWRDDSPGHDFGDGDVIGPHVNAWNNSKGVNSNLHLLY